MHLPDWYPPYRTHNPLRRDKVSISMVLLTPLFQLIILGYAINMDPHFCAASSESTGIIEKYPVFCASVTKI
jgi:hypothetical protein